jgi:hypothetical protein
MKIAVFSANKYDREFLTAENGSHRRKERLCRIIGRISPENTTMKTVSEQVGFRLRFDRKESECLAEMNL